MERLAEIDTVVFDKTGTLTMGRSRLINARDDRPRRAGIGGRHRLALAPSAVAGDLRGRAAQCRSDRAFRARHRISGAWHRGRGRYRSLQARARRLGAATARGMPADLPIPSLARNGRAIASFVFEDSRRGRRRRGAVRAAPGRARRSRCCRATGVASAQAMAGALSIDAFARRDAAGRQGRAPLCPGAGGAQGADGRRRPERRAGAGCGACLDGARHRRRCRAQRRRLRVPARKPEGGAAGVRRLAAMPIG